MHLFYVLLPLITLLPSTHAAAVCHICQLEYPLAWCDQREEVQQVLYLRIPYLGIPPTKRNPQAFFCDNRQECLRVVDCKAQGKVCVHPISAGGEGEPRCVVKGEKVDDWTWY
jgi:hypothetical protein